MRIMNILIINASPRQKGAISSMLDAMRQKAEELQHQTVMVRTADLHIKHCTGCMYCRTHGICCLPPDDAQRVLEQINQCDLLIIGAPCYWGNMPGELKILFDRIVYGMMGESKRGLPLPLHQGKKAIIVSTCTTPYPFNILFRQTRGVVKALKEILKWSGFKVCATYERGGTKNKPLCDKDLQKCRRLVAKQ